MLFCHLSRSMPRTSGGFFVRRSTQRLMPAAPTARFEGAPRIGRSTFVPSVSTHCLADAATGGSPSGICGRPSRMPSRGSGCAGLSFPPHWPAAADCHRHSLARTDMRGSDPAPVPNARHAGDYHGHDLYATRRYYYRDRYRAPSLPRAWPNLDQRLERKLPTKFYFVCSQCSFHLWSRLLRVCVGSRGSSHAHRSRIVYRMHVPNRLRLR